MKLFGRFALVAILGSLMASALLAGCGGGDTDNSAGGAGGSTSGAAGNGASGNGASGNAASVGNKTS